MIKPPLRECMEKKPIYQRVLLKLSGETLLGTHPFGIQQESCMQIAHYLSQFHRAG